MNDINETIRRQREYFGSGATRPVEFRREMLKALRTALERHEEELYAALYEDLHKGREEAFLTELSIVYQEISAHLHGVARWSRRRSVRPALQVLPSRSHVTAEPLGTALIVAPWNYPVNLLFTPLVGAISAGCTAVLKSSPYTPHVDEVMERIVTETFDERYIAYFRGGREVNTALLAGRYDIIFFTGSPSLGRVVMEAAAKHLTPVVLELGGKSPCIVDRTADVEMAAKRTVWGKTLNAGQTCIAPDYLFIHKDVKERFMKAARKYIKEFYGENPMESPIYPRIVSEKAMKRLVRLLKSDGETVIGGEYDMGERYIAPTFIDGIDPDSDIMQEEIFGPVMPVMEFETIESVIEYINSHEKPLALYYFGDRGTARRVTGRTSSGGVCVNDTIMHIANPHLPFGGVGNSGMGAYHHRRTFEAFTHRKAVLVSNKRVELPVKYPPYKWVKCIKGLLK